MNPIPINMAAVSKQPDVSQLLITLLDDAKAALGCDRESAHASLAEAMRLLAANDTAEWRPHGGLAGWQIRRVIAYVDEHLNTTIRSRDLANVAHLSLSHFAHAFKQAFNETPLAYVGRRRLEQACRMMLCSNESLASIARECGYYDQSHFTRNFHRAMGVSPQTWRRRHAQGPPGIATL